MTYQEQQKEILEIQQKNKSVCGLPFDNEQCDECQYRDKEWEKLLGERLIEESGDYYFLRSGE